jgi:hypothetical protein
MLHKISEYFCEMELCEGIKENHVCADMKCVLQFSLLITIHFLQMMYLTYVRNCKFVSPSALPSIRFMRQSLAEIFALDEAASYQHVFLYVRQLAIHLRNAITLHKKVPKHEYYIYIYIYNNEFHFFSACCIYMDLKHQT